MEPTLPNDADGDALRRIVRDGSDLSKPMLIDFHVALPSESAAKSFAELARGLGYHVSVYESVECSLPWTCECSKGMLATYHGVLAAQAELAELSKDLGGWPDGWGTLGNR